MIAACLFTFLATLPAPTPSAALDGLGMGSKAPALTVEEWLQGSTVSSFTPGHVYVVEFWATWCPPCVKSIPHLNELSKKHTGKVTVLGIAGSERNVDKDLAKARGVVADFVKARKDSMTYPVAFDIDASMSRDWMQAAGIGGIPTSFIVDGTGTIAWIGHPMEMDQPLDAVVAGKWDIQAEKKKAEERKALEAKAEEVYGGIAQALANGEHATVLSALDKAFLETPALEELLGIVKFQTLLLSKDYAGVSSYGAKLVDGPCKDQAGVLNHVAWLIVDPEDTTIEKRDYQLAIRAATRASEIAGGKDASILDTLATAYFGSGDVTRAIETQTKAVELAQGAQKEELAKRLEEFKKGGK